LQYFFSILHKFVHIICAKQSAYPPPASECCYFQQISLKKALCLNNLQKINLFKNQGLNLFPGACAQACPHNVCKIEKNYRWKTPLYALKIAA